MSGPMILHWSPRSPYVREVMIAAHEMGLTDRIVTVRTIVGGTTPHAELMTLNPLGKIPTLELEDGTVIYDSPDHIAATRAELARCFPFPLRIEASVLGNHAALSGAVAIGYRFKIVSAIFDNQPQRHITGNHFPCRSGIP